MTRGHARGGSVRAGRHGDQLGANPEPKSSLMASPSRVNVPVCDSAQWPRSMIHDTSTPTSKAAPATTIDRAPPASICMAAEKVFSHRIQAMTCPTSDFSMSWRAPHFGHWMTGMANSPSRLRKWVVKSLHYSAAESKLTQPQADGKCLPKQPFTIGGFGRDDLGDHLPPFVGNGERPKDGHDRGPMPIIDIQSPLPASPCQVCQAKSPIPNFAFVLGFEADQSIDPIADHVGMNDRVQRPIEQHARPEARQRPECVSGGGGAPHLLQKRIAQQSFELR